MACCDAQIDQNPAPLARSLAIIKEPASGPWAAELALLRSLRTLKGTEARHRLERQYNACANLLQKCLPVRWTAWDEQSMRAAAGAFGGQKLRRNVRFNKFLFSFRRKLSWKTESGDHDVVVTAFDLSASPTGTVLVTTLTHLMLYWVDRYFDSCALLGLFCLLRVSCTHLETGCDGAWVQVPGGCSWTWGSDGRVVTKE